MRVRTRVYILYCIVLINGNRRQIDNVRENVRAAVQRRRPRLYTQREQYQCLSAAIFDRTRVCRML